MPPATPRHRPSEQATAVLARVAPLVSRWVERVLAEGDPPLTLAQYLALEELAAGGVRATDLASGAAVSRSAASQLVASLGAAGLVERREASEDRRLQPLGLTAAGTRALRASRRLLGRRLDPLLAELPRPEAEALARSLGRIEEVMRGKAPPRRPPRPPRRGPPM
jgi:DNA-binding MarR family transcriptional regulator